MSEPNFVVRRAQWRGSSHHWSHGVLHGAAQANVECLDRLLASLTMSTDVSACNLLTLTDGQVIAVRTEHGLFVQSASGPTSTHYFINVKRNRIETQTFASRHTYPPMDRAQPDAKQYYYPFYGPERTGAMSASPKTAKSVCQAVATFQAAGDVACHSHGALYGDAV